MLIMRLFAKIDKAITEAFGLGAWGTGGTEITQWIYLTNLGRTVGVVGTDGEIHTLMGYWSVRHYYEDGKLVKRIPVRKDLKEGERLATSKEIDAYRKGRQEEFEKSGGISFVC